MKDAGHIAPLTTRAGMAGAVSRWLGSVEGLSEIVQRLLRVQIENHPAIDVIKRYDSSETLFYCDPPYPHDSRGDARAYAYEMTDEEHRELAHVLQNVQGKVAVSGYDCSLMQELYADCRCESSYLICGSSNTIRHGSKVTVFFISILRFEKRPSFFNHF
ncbi:DNA adenine methylase [Plectonema radiosum NIES-515]|uniref:DNA adenine methylase n=1 Tax=Plectonema radiosum NIES-515 TaxID=2986073 RepID=A0ABT3ATF0_9CYAN|nr:DNA adenine methylase [Plectonema radiosum]MCV3212402.1 DNA adenine methylase [Plectonema radiosum NIES-515]